MIYAVHAEIIRSPIMAVTRRHILESGRMLDENAARGLFGLPCKPIAAVGVSVANPANLNCNSAIEHHRLDRFTLTEGELRSPDVWIASVQRSRSSHALTEATLPSPTPGVPAYLRGRLKRELSQRCPPSLRPNCQGSKSRFDTFAARTRCVTVSRPSRLPKGDGRTGKVISAS